VLKQGKRLHKLNATCEKKNPRGAVLEGGKAKGKLAIWQKKQLKVIGKKL